jgi:hypothetical protein
LEIFAYSVPYRHSSVPSLERSYSLETIGANAGWTATVAAAQGKYGHAWLYFESKEGNDDNKEWRGKFQLIDGLNAAIGVAGMIAELIVDDHNVTADELIDFWQYEVQIPSPTDLLHVPESWEERLVVVKESLSILRRNEQFHNRVVEHLR